MFSYVFMFPLCIYNVVFIKMIFCKDKHSPATKNAYRIFKKFVYWSIKWRERDMHRLWILNNASQDSKDNNNIFLQFLSKQKVLSPILRTFLQMWTHNQNKCLGMNFDLSNRYNIQNDKMICFAIILYKMSV
jgi:hypothetical protein